jgi:hypothetical protein
MILNWIIELWEWVEELWKDFLQFIKKIIIKSKEIKYCSQDVLEMKKYTPTPQRKEDQVNFGKDEERKDQGQIMVDKIKKNCDKLFQRSLERDDKKIQYLPETYKEPCIIQQKEKIGGWSPGSSIEKGTYNASKCEKIKEYKECSSAEYKKHHVENTLRNILKGTDDVGTYNQFSQDHLDFTNTISKKLNEKSKSPRK